MTVDEVRKKLSKIPKKAIVNALRNLNLGPSNLSMQSKGDLLSITRQTLNSEKGSGLASHISDEWKALEPLHWTAHQSVSPNP